ncbi:hypothetical protein Ga0123462_1559 [Mariprofundus ferrinatatus]|uniref:YdhG-like domain-containing protein n=1 Tax=Mariprofundus ferrinatatus TaxID=1921087 RepID=A0A2K8L524_9PROT|nr:DUF1801 domain-containing protein [Mariprofundus ferrinatatus]ATX82418.1 hypothetical protein Ga0123462_1559 [Mariprofundus ferrinatatus]
MTSSNNEQVQSFLDDIIVSDPDKSDIIEKLRKVVFQTDSNINERMMYGGIMLSLERDFGGIFAYKNHVSFEFSFGASLDDPSNILEGGGKFRRHIKIHGLADIEAKKVASFVKQALELSINS